MAITSKTIRRDASL